MNKIDAIISAMTLLLWFVFIFTKDPIIGTVLGFGIGWTCTRFFFFQKTNKYYKPVYAKGGKYEQTR